MSSERSSTPTDARPSGASSPPMSRPPPLENRWQWQRENVDPSHTPGRLPSHAAASPHSPGGSGRAMAAAPHKPGMTSPVSSGNGPSGSTPKTTVVAHRLSQIAANGRLPAGTGAGIGIVPLNPSHSKMGAVHSARGRPEGQTVNGWDFTAGEDTELQIIAGDLPGHEPLPPHDGPPAVGSSSAALAEGHGPSPAALRNATRPASGSPLVGGVLRNGATPPGRAAPTVYSLQGRGSPTSKPHGGSPTGGSGALAEGSAAGAAAATSSSAGAGATAATANASHTTPTVPRHTLSPSNHVRTSPYQWQAVSSSDTSAAAPTGINVVCRTRQQSPTSGYTPATAAMTNTSNATPAQGSRMGGASGGIDASAAATHTTHQDPSAGMRASSPSSSPVTATAPAAARATTRPPHQSTQGQGWPAHAASARELSSPPVDGLFGAAFAVPPGSLPAAPMGAGPPSYQPPQSFRGGPAGRGAPIHAAAAPFVSASAPATSMSLAPSAASGMATGMRGLQAPHGGQWVTNWGAPSGAAPAIAHAVPTADNPTATGTTPTTAGVVTSSNRNEGPIGAGTEFRRPLTEKDWQAVRDYVMEHEQHLHYPSVRLPEAMLNQGTTEVGMRRLQQREKQIRFGKETEGYRKYTTCLPDVSQREFHNPMHPVTPRPEKDCSKRAFDHHLNVWRRMLHQWDSYDPAHPEPHFALRGTATLGELSLAERSASARPRPVNAAEAPSHQHQATLPSIAALTADNAVGGGGGGPNGNGAVPVLAAPAAPTPFTGREPSSSSFHGYSLTTPLHRLSSPNGGLDCPTPILTFDAMPYGSGGERASGRGAYMAPVASARGGDPSLAAATPNRPQSVEGPELDSNFFNFGESALQSGPSGGGWGRMGSQEGVAGAGSSATQPPQQRATPQFHHSACQGLGNKGPSTASPPARATPFGGGAYLADRTPVGAPEVISQVLRPSFDLVQESARASPAGSWAAAGGAAGAHCGSAKGGMRGGAYPQSSPYRRMDSSNNGLASSGSMAMHTTMVLNTIPASHATPPYTEQQQQQQQRGPIQPTRQQRGGGNGSGVGKPNRGSRHGVPSVHLNAREDVRQQQQQH